MKIYSREISRYFPEGKLNFIIYPKASMLQFTSNNSSIEKEINSSWIEPLVLKDVIVKAKRKE